MSGRRKRGTCTINSRTFRWYSQPLLAGAVMTFLWSPARLHPQFTDPRYYDNTPVNVNQLEIVYGYARSDTSLDASIVVGDAELNLNFGVLEYTRYFSLFHHAAWAEPAVPFGNMAGSVSGTQIRSSSAGTGDSSYQAGILLKGGRALSVAQFATYHPSTTLGTSLSITAPTGQYSADKILNLGSNRWSFKPEFAVAFPFGPQKKWELDTYANAYFYTENTSYHGAHRFQQKPLPGIEGHISYSFRSNAWASVDTRYSFGGDTLVNGVDQKDGQENFTLGSEVNVSLNSRNIIVLEFGKLIVHQNGPTYGGFGVKYFYSWGKGYAAQ
jgi:hypothetical protein